MAVPSSGDPSSPSAVDRDSKDADAVSPVVVPPYWQAHARTTSQASVVSNGNGRPAPISLQDNTVDGPGVSSPLWARVVTIHAHTIVSGNFKGVGDYVVWICKVETLDVRY
jgi:hypothetical protein